MDRKCDCCGVEFLDGDIIIELREVTRDPTDEYEFVTDEDFQYVHAECVMEYINPDELLHLRHEMEQELLDDADALHRMAAENMHHTNFLGEVLHEIAEEEALEEDRRSRRRRRRR